MVLLVIAVACLAILTNIIGYEDGKRRGLADGFKQGQSQMLAEGYRRVGPVPGSFENYLKMAHAVNYEGTDDDMSDAFETWLSEMAGDDLISYADARGKKFRGV